MSFLIDGMGVLQKLAEEAQASMEEIGQEIGWLSKELPSEQ
jgi:hypothetical protein